MNPIQFARNVSRQVHKRLGGVYVQIERDEILSDPILVTVGYSKSFEDDLDIIRAEYRQVDFLFNASDYRVDGVIVEPAIGDVIYRTVGGEALAFEVEPHNSEFVALYEDNDRQVVRVHTKEIYNG